MAPEKRNQASLFRSWIKNYPDSIFTTDSKIIFCNACSQQVPATKSFHLRQHSETAKHQSNLKRYGSEQQQLISSSFSRSETSDTFLEELCDSFLAANIPLWKLTNEVLREFLSKYCKRIIPDESTLRKKYVDICYQKAMARIRVEVGSGYVWASVDESTDCQGRYVANLLVGMLHSSEFHVPSLVAVKMLEATNHSTVARFVNDGLRALGIAEENLLLLVTDGAKYMIKAAQALQVFYPSMLHVTFICHGLHRVAEEVRGNFQDVDLLVSNTKKIFSKAPSRLARYKAMCPDIPLPPQPVLTRWSSWLEAAIFYSENFRAIKSVIDTFDQDDAVSIRKAQEAFSSKSVANHLAYIKSNFQAIPLTIKKMEGQGLPVTTIVYLLDELKKKLSGALGEVGEAVLRKFEAVMAKNPGIEKFRNVAKILEGLEANIDIPPDKIASLKFAPLQSCDVERTFSVYKSILDEKRTSLTAENLEKYLICNCEHRK